MAAQLFVKYFKEIDRDDLPLVGGKGANLGEMTKAGFPVPYGFAVTVRAYDEFLKQNNLDTDIEEKLKGLDTDDPEALTRVSESIRERLTKSLVPKEVFKEVRESYHNIRDKYGGKLVAVRSSATAEDLPEASFAGQQASYLNVEGDNNLMEKVKACWASLFTPRAIFYRKENKIDHQKVKISVIVQKMIQSKVSGVMFSIDPVTNDKNQVVIEAVWGLGETIVQGLAIPDRYSVQKETFLILAKSISEQTKQLIRVKGENKEVEVADKYKDKQKIADKMIVELAKLADKLQKHYYFPQDIEWAIEDDLYIVQTRPVTTIDKKKTIVEDKGNFRVAQMPVLKGVAASPGIATGPVVIVKNPKEIERVKKGDVLVSTMTSPDFVPAMKKAAAIVTDEGGQTSHAAIVSRELGIPCVVGTKEATKVLNDGEIVSVDAKEGFIYRGAKVTQDKVSSEKAVKDYSDTKTATKLYVNLAEGHLAEAVAKKNVDGVGLLRAEFMVAEIGIHPKEAIKKKKQKDYVEKLTKGILGFCKAFHPRPVVYRTTDFKTNEYRQLEGGRFWEPEEPNPMLGFRGAFRYIQDPEVFRLELLAIKKVREDFDNLWVMLPFVRSPEELGQVRRQIEAEDLFNQSSFKLWMMVELPVNVISLKDFIKVGIDGVSVGSNDLAMLVTGTDRDNSEVASVFNERSKAVLWALRRTIRICQKQGITSSICGQAPSFYDDLVEKLVGYGITSISVNPDSINRVRGVIKEKELAIARGK